MSEERNPGAPGDESRTRNEGGMSNEDGTSSGRGAVSDDGRKGGGGTRRGADPEITRLVTAFGFLLLGVSLPWILERTPDVLERVYDPWIFRPLARLLATIGNAISPSLAQIWVAVAVLALLALLVRHIRKIRREGRPAWVPVLATWATLAAVLVWSFHFVWGLHYARIPFRERTGLPAVEVTTERLSRLTRLLANEVNLAHRMAVQLGEIEPAADSSSVFLVDRQRLLEALERGYPMVLPDTRGFVTSRPKFPEPAGWLLTRLGISGIYFPFTGEASVNGRMPPVSMPFVAAHEMAHQKGIAREDEANAIGYLACRSAGLWATRYSGALAAYRRSWGAVYRADIDSTRALAPSRLLDGGPEADLRAIRAFWQRHEGVASHVAERTNDTYLKANAQRAGVQSYGRMIDILVSLEEIGMIGE